MNTKKFRPAEDQESITKAISLLGKKCHKCKKGKYEECDIFGTNLKCPQCNDDAYFWVFRLKKTRR